MVKNIDSKSFTREVLGADKPVLVDFWASWCGPCRMIAPAVESVSEEMEGKAGFCKVNVDEEPDLAQQYSVMSIPTLLVFKNGRKVADCVGVKTADEIADMLWEYVD